MSRGCLLHEPAGEGEASQPAGTARRRPKLSQAPWGCILALSPWGGDKLLPVSWLPVCVLKSSLVLTTVFSGWCFCCKHPWATSSRPSPTS